MEANSSHALDHVVVLMFENRSFDNLLGYLYSPAERENFEGVIGKNLSNPVPKDLYPNSPGNVPVHVANSMDIPDPNPGEEYPHINTQLFETVIPEQNRFAEVGDMVTPYNVPQDTSSPTMRGFVSDYIGTFRTEIGRLPIEEEYSQIMACYQPSQIPALSTVARGFAVFDHWFCDVPSQTFANRSFFHAASSSGLVNNIPLGKFSVLNTSPTIFERMESNKVTWKIYYDYDQILSVTALIHASRLYPFFATHFGTMENFYEDAKNGKLPNYSFIEPNMVYPHTDMHPPFQGRLRRGLRLPPQNAILGGEQLLTSVYNAIKYSSSESGSNWSNTFLLITFDEHGGTYDHVPPPTVSPPGGTGRNEMDFKFDRLGLRVPTIAVSAWVEPGTVVNEEYRHTSMIRTLIERWTLGDPLTERDATAKGLSSIISRSSPITPEKWPALPEMEVTFGSEVLSSLELPLTTLEKELLAEALVFEAKLNGTGTVEDVESIGHRDAHGHLLRLKKKWFPQIETKIFARSSE